MLNAATLENRSVFKNQLRSRNADLEPDYVATSIIRENTEKSEIYKIYDFVDIMPGVE